EAPVAWTQGERVPVPTRFVRKGSDWGFDVADYSGTLILDPGLKWGTYFGGEGQHNGLESNAINAEMLAGDHIYMTGEIESTTLIATVGAHQTSHGGGVTDVFLAKFDATGNIVWSTYFGGNDEERAHNVVADEFAHVY